MGDSPQGSRSNVLTIASLVLSMIALFVAISGAANAGNTKLPANSVGTKQIKDGAVTAPDLGSKAVTARAVGDNSVTTAAIAPDAVTAQDLATGAVESDAIAAEAVTTDAVAPLAIRGPQIATGAAGPRVIEDGGVNTLDIATGAVHTENMNPKSVKPSIIADNAVGTTQLAPNAVTSNVLAPAAVTSGNIADGAILPDAFGAFPMASVSAHNVPVATSSPGCFYHDYNNAYDGEMPFDTENYDTASMFDPTKPAELRTTRGGIYTVTVTGTWEPGGGTLRAIDLFQYAGNILGSAQAVPVSGQETSVSTTVTIALPAGSGFTIESRSCGATATLKDMTMTATWIAPAY